MQLTELQWTKMIHDQEQSSLSVKKFCEINEIGYSTFFLKRRQLENISTGFQEVMIESTNHWIEFSCNDLNFRVKKQDVPFVLRTLVIYD